MNNQHEFSITDKVRDGLFNADDALLLKWYGILNEWGLVRNLIECYTDTALRDFIMRYIKDKLGEYKILRYHNHDKTDAEFKVFWNHCQNPDTKKEFSQEYKDITYSEKKFKSIKTSQQELCIRVFKIGHFIREDEEIIAKARIEILKNPRAFISALNDISKEKLVVMQWVDLSNPQSNPEYYEQ